MHVFKRLYNHLLIISALCLSLALQADEKIVVLNWDNVPKDFPIKLVKNDNASIGDIMDYEVRPLQFAIKNVSDKDLDIETIMPGCPCIIFKEKLENFVLKAQQEFAFKAEMHGRELRPGAFARVIYIQAKGLPLAEIAFKGTLVPKVTYEPSRKIDLGTYNGDVNWTRSCTLTLNLPQKDLDLTAPEDEFFNLKVTKLEPLKFKVDISPKKLPMKRGRYDSKFLFPVKGISGYGPIPIIINLSVHYHTFHTQDSSFFISPKTIDVTKEHTISTDIFFGADPNKRSSRFERSRRRTSHRRFGVVSLPVSVEEQKAFPLDTKKTWESFAKIMKAKLPQNTQGVSVSFVPQNDHMTLKVTFAPNYFTQKPHGRLRLPVIYKGTRFADLRFGW